MGNEQSANEEFAQNGYISKHENGSINGISAKTISNGSETDVKTDITVYQNGESISLNLATEPSNGAIVEPDAQPVNAQVISATPETNNKTEDVKRDKEAKSPRFGKLFKKKDRKGDGEKLQHQVDESNFPSDPKQETDNLKQDSEPPPEAEILVSSPEEDKVPVTANGNGQPVESQEDSDAEENPVMNFFKTLVTPTKTSKKETAAHDATKDQSLMETPPAAPTTVAQISEPPAVPKGMPAPPPPPPEPPKMEIKGEPAAKPVKSAPKQDPKVAKEAETSRGKSARDTLSRFFRPKETPVEVPQPVVNVQIESKVEPLEAAVEMIEDVLQPFVEAEKVDPSKTSTLEAAAKPEPPPPAQEEKKADSKSSLFSFFKPKVLLDHMTTKVQAASTSGVRLIRKTTGLAADPKKMTPTPPAEAEAAQAVKAKEEPKAAAKSPEAVVESKLASVASQSGDDAPNVPRKLEKRNSIQLFFKNLGQKRHSTDAGVQTEPVTVAPAAEKAK
ncbi:breast carcinoma-amplified sequence 1 isoform 2-T2 [Menidia menidia]